MGKFSAHFIDDMEDDDDDIFKDLFIDDPEIISNNWDYFPQ